MTVILIFLLLPIALTFFMPFAYICYGLAFCVGIVALVMGFGFISTIGISIEDGTWGGGLLIVIVLVLCTVGLYFLGKVLGDLMLADIIRMIF